MISLRETPPRRALDWAIYAYAASSLAARCESSRMDPRVFGYFTRNLLAWLGAQPDLQVMVATLWELTPYHDAL